MQNVTPSDLTLVIGSSGKTGSRIAKRLAKAGRAVRLGSRSANTPFEWNNPSGWPAVLEGVKAVYIAYYPDLAVAEAPGHISQLMDACKAAGVEKIVLLSGRGETECERARPRVTWGRARCGRRGAEESPQRRRAVCACGVCFPQCSCTHRRCISDFT